MSEQQSRLQYLLLQYAKNLCTRAELVELLEASKRDGNNPDLHNALMQIEADLDLNGTVAGLDKEQIFSNILQSADIKEQPIRRINWYKWSAAAAILLFIGFGLYFNRDKPDRVLVNKVNQVPAIVPGTDKAELILANGKRVLLNNSTNGHFTTDGTTTTLRLDKGQLAYSGKATESDLSAYNMLSIPVGGQYQVTLPDGTKVWLNSASSLRFPSEFGSDRRHVELKGEGYFEVAKDKTRPFTVSVNGQEIKVLGTHFNIMGYTDEASTNTTLLEGSIEITKGKDVKRLTPGDQAKVDDAIHIARVDVSESVEWKNGNFNFSHEKIESIMRKLARWYNVEIAYHGKITKEGFVGTIPRSKNLTEVLDVLETTGLVHFKIQERRVIVMP